MKLTRLTAAIIAATTALTPLTFTPALSAPPTVFAEDTGALAKLPDWIPNDFDSAVNFRNTYGATHIDNGLICIVYPNCARRGASKDTYGFDLKTPKNMGQKLKHEIYTSEYTEACFDVFVYQPLKQGDISLTLVDPHVEIKDSVEEWEPPAVAEYTFAVDKELTITETDIFSWLPDGKAEYSEYTKIHGEVSVKDNYVVFCTMKVDQFGDKWEPDSNNKYENIKFITASNCTMQVPELYDDGSVDIIYVYQAVKDGNEKISWIRTSDARPNQSEPTPYVLTADCAILDNAQTILLPGQLRTTLVDHDTGEPVMLTDNKITYIWTNLSDGEVSTGPYLEIETNPAIADNNLGKSFGSRGFSFGVERDTLPSGYSFICDDPRPGYYGGAIFPEGSMTVTTFDNKAANVVFWLKFTPTGDVNNDGEFNVSDVVLLQKWLLSAPDIKLSNWKAADFCTDGKLDVFDLICMKKALVDPNAEKYVKPDIFFDFGTPFSVLSDSLKLYLGPDESYKTIATIDHGVWLSEYGYQKNNNTWLFTEHNGQYGWIKTVEDDGKTPTIQFQVAAKKPVIYLYPESETDVHVELELTEAELSTTYPKYNNGWDVVAYPDGSLLNKADGSHHKYLFWDAVNCRTRFDLSKGFCVAGSDTESFLKEKLTYMGLTEEEMNEFIVYWLPLMEHNAYNLITFQGDAYTNSAKLDITPAPDSECRIFMAYVPLENAVKIEPQQLETFERKGFTVVEWGGCEIKSQIRS